MPYCLPHLKASTATIAPAARLRQRALKTQFIITWALVLSGALLASSYQILHAISEHRNVTHSAGLLAQIRSITLLIGSNPRSSCGVSRRTRGARDCDHRNSASWTNTGNFARIAFTGCYMHRLALIVLCASASCLAAHRCVPKRLGRSTALGALLLRDGSSVADRISAASPPEC